MNYKGDGGYEVVYPSVMIANIGDFTSYMNSNYYTKEEVNNNVESVSFKKTLIYSNSYKNLLNATQDVTAKFNATNESINKIVGLIFSIKNANFTGIPSSVYNIGIYIRNTNYYLLSVTSDNGFNGNAENNYSSDNILLRVGYMGITNDEKTVTFMGQPTFEGYSGVTVYVRNGTDYEEHGNLYFQISMTQQVYVSFDLEIYSLENNSII